MAASTARLPLFLIRFQALLVGRRVFGAPTIGGWLALAAAVVVATASGLLVQRRLYPPQALSAVSYATAWVIGLGAIAALR